MPEEKQKRKQLPVTLISGFLGAGKTTLLRNILEARQDDGNFRCAVLVNDMAELNIDKNLIASSGLVRSDEIISMQNGCVCCNLSGELIEQIVSLALNEETPFDYLVIEASGVSEPAAVAALFEGCEDDDHDHGAHPPPRSLSEVARMDTIVTVVDAAEFLQNLDLMDGPDKKHYPRLLVDQVEYSNVVLLNKIDLVSESQLREVKDKVVLLTAGKDTRILSTENSAVDVAEVVDTKRYRSEDFDLSRFVTQFDAPDANNGKSCCRASIARGESPCCRRARTVDSGRSQVLLPSKKVKNTRHEENYGITSFVYKARRPFLPLELHENFIDKFFMSEEDEEDEEEEEGDEEEKQEDDDDDDGEPAETSTNDEDAPAPPAKKKSKISGENFGAEEARRQQHLETIRQMQEEGARKKKVRTAALGSVLRVKGYLWQGNSHDLVGYVSTAGNLSRIDSPGRWACLERSSWTSSGEEEDKKIRENWVSPYGDRRQELVFIGQDLKHGAIQKILDDCLAPDDVMALGVDGWKATMGDIMLDD